MAIKVRHDPVRAIGRAAYRGGIPEAVKLQLMERETARRSSESFFNRVLKERALEQRGELAERGFEEQKERMELAGELGKERMEFAADLGKDQADYEQELKQQGFEMQYTIKDRQRMAQLNRGKQYIREQVAAGTITEEEGKQALLELHSAFHGIRKSQIPIKKSPYPEGQGLGQVWTDPKIPGFIQSRDDKGNVKLTPLPDVATQPKTTRELPYKERLSLMAKAESFLVGRMDSEGNKIPYTDQDVVDLANKWLRAGLEQEGVVEPEVAAEEPSIDWYYTDTGERVTDMTVGGGARRGSIDPSMQTQPEMEAKYQQWKQAKEHLSDDVIAWARKNPNDPVALMVLKQLGER